MKRNEQGTLRERRAAGWRARRRRDWQNVCCTYCLKNSGLKGRFGRAEIFRGNARARALKEQSAGY